MASQTPPPDPLPGGLKRRLGPVQRYGVRATLFAMALVLLAVPFAFLLIQVLLQGPVARWDVTAGRAIHAAVRERPLVVGAMRGLTKLGDPLWFWVLVPGACVLLWVRDRRWRPIIYLVITGLLGGAIDTVVKVLVARPRPQMEEPIADAFGKSFPSGHTYSSVVVYGALLLVFMPWIAARARPWVVAVVVLMVSGIGLSRLVLGVHYVSDVLGGAVLGTAWLSASTAAFSIWRAEEGKEPVHPMEGVEPEAAG